MGLEPKRTELDVDNGAMAADSVVSSTPPPKEGEDALGALIAMLAKKDSRPVAVDSTNIWGGR